MTTETAFPHAAKPQDASVPDRRARDEFGLIDFEHYRQEAQRMRAEVVAGYLERWFAGFGRLFARNRVRNDRGQAAPRRAAESLASPMV